MKKCVACAEEILLEAKLCKYCETLQSDSRFAKANATADVYGDDESTDQNSPPAPHDDQFLELDTPIAVNRAPQATSTSKPSVFNAIGREANSTKRSKFRVLALVGGTTFAIAVLGTLAVGLIPPSSPLSDATSTKANVPTGENAANSPGNQTATADASELESGSPTLDSAEAVPETSPLSSAEPSESEKDIRSQLQDALDSWLAKAKAPQTATFVEEEGIFQGCPEDMCGPLTDFNISFQKFPSEFGNNACQVLVNVKDRANGKLLNRHAEEWTLLGEVHVGIASLSTSLYLDGVSSSGLMSTYNLRVSCMTIEGLTESTKKFNLEILISN